MSPLGRLRLHRRSGRRRGAQWRGRGCYCALQAFLSLAAKVTTIEFDAGFTV